MVGGADGVANGGIVFTNGAAVFDGNTSSVVLPGNLFTNYDSISFEIWIVDEVNTLSSGSPKPAAYLYNFTGAGGSLFHTIALTNSPPLNFSTISPFDQGGYSTPVTNEAVIYPAPVADRISHIVWTQDSNSQTARIYLNGVLAGSASNFTLTPALIGSTVTNCIGAFDTNGTSGFHGSIVEFRVYQGAMTPLDVALTDAAGPDQPQVVPGDLQDVRVMVPSPLGPGALLSPGVFADFANLTNVNIIGQPELILSSDNTNVMVVTTNQMLRTIGLGTANITAVYQGMSNSLAVTVAVPDNFTLIHRYGFGEPSGTSVAHDSIGGANGRVLGKGLFNGTNEVSLGGGAYVALPPGIISCLSETTIEAWVTWKGGGDWQRIFDFGSYTSNYIFLTPATDSFSRPLSPGYRALHTAITTNQNIAETPRLNWTNTLPIGTACQVVVSYSPVQGIMKLYLNGVPVSSGIATIQLADIKDVNDWLGRSQFPRDPPFSGLFDEFRIYNGLLQDSDVMTDYIAGPDAVGVNYILRTSVSGTDLTLSWDPAMATWTLESSPVLGSGAIWTPVGTTPVFQNGRYTVTLPMSDNAGYFRMHEL